MQEVFADSARLEGLPDGRDAIPLGPNKDRPDLAAIEGQIVMLVEWGNVQAPGRIMQHDGWWYGVLTGIIQDIHPEAQAAS
jgi:hypothetical protein